MPQYEETWSFWPTSPPWNFRNHMIQCVVVLRLLSVTGVHLLLGVVTAPLLRIPLFLLGIPLLFLIGIPLLFLLGIPLLFLLGIPLLFLLGIPLRFLVLLFVGRHHLLIRLILVTIRASTTVIIAIVPYCTTVPFAILSINPSSTLSSQ
ncbi:unnamed protein product [Closterium sp. NIES-65]|nr:unnamed protein product [Closterium sp. NIES-65]